MNLELITPITPAASTSTLLDTVDQISCAAKLLDNIEIDHYVDLLEDLLDDENYEAVRMALPLIVREVNEAIVAARR